MYTNKETFVFYVSSWISLIHACQNKMSKVALKLIQFQNILIIIKKPI